MKREPYTKEELDKLFGKQSYLPFPNEKKLPDVIPPIDMQESTYEKAPKTSSVRKFFDKNSLEKNAEQGLKDTPPVTPTTPTMPVETKIETKIDKLQGVGNTEVAQQKKGWFGF